MDVGIGSVQVMSTLGISPWGSCRSSWNMLDRSGGGHVKVCPFTGQANVSVQEFLRRFAIFAVDNEWDGEREGCTFSAGIRRNGVQSFGRPKRWVYI